MEQRLWCLAVSWSKLAAAFASRRFLRSPALAYAKLVPQTGQDFPTMKKLSRQIPHLFCASTNPISVWKASQRGQHFKSSCLLAHAEASLCLMTKAQV